jgi:hypothetical protein
MAMSAALSGLQGIDAKLTCPWGDVHLNISLYAGPATGKATRVIASDVHFMMCLRGWRKATI